MCSAYYAITHFSDSCKTWFSSCCLQYVEVLSITFHIPFYFAFSFLFLFLIIQCKCSLHKWMFSILISVNFLSVIFFFAYLLSHQINKRMRQCLILLCEAHFAALYILQLSLVSRKLEQKGSISLEVLQELGVGFSQSYLKCLPVSPLIFLHSQLSMFANWFVKCLQVLYKVIVLGSSLKQLCLHAFVPFITMVLKCCSRFLKLSNTHHILPLDLAF